MEFFHRICQVIRVSLNEIVQQEQNAETVELTFSFREGLKNDQTIAEIARTKRNGQEETVETINHSLLISEKKQATANNLKFRLYDSPQFSRFPFDEHQNIINVPDNFPQVQKFDWNAIEEFFISLTSSSEIENEWETLEEFATKISA